MTPERERIGTYNGIRGQRISLAAGPELRRVGSYLPAFGFVWLTLTAGVGPREGE
jgi:hypothetical protein